MSHRRHPLDIVDTSIGRVDPYDHYRVDKMRCPQSGKETAVSMRTVQIADALPGLEIVE